MNGKQRVLNAVNHVKSDRFPMDIWAEPEVWEVLKDHFGVSTDDDVRNKLGTDIRYIQPPSTIERGQPDKEGIWYDEWGVGYKHIKHATGYYDDVVYHPLANATTVKEVEVYPWPDPSKYDFGIIEEKCLCFKDKALIGGNGHFFVRAPI